MEWVLQLVQINKVLVDVHVFQVIEEVLVEELDEDGGGLQQAELDLLDVAKNGLLHFLNLGLSEQAELLHLCSQAGPNIFHQAIQILQFVLEAELAEVGYLLHQDFSKHEPQPKIEIVQRIDARHELLNCDFVAGHVFPSKHTLNLEQAINFHALNLG